MSISSDSVHSFPLPHLVCSGLSPFKYHNGARLLVPHTTHLARRKIVLASHHAHVVASSNYVTDNRTFPFPSHRIAALSKQTPGTVVLPRKEEGPHSQPHPPRCRLHHALRNVSLRRVSVLALLRLRRKNRPSHPGIVALGMPENLVKAVIPIHHTLSSPIMCGFPEHYVDRNTVPAEAGLEHVPLDELSVFNAQAGTLNSPGRRQPLRE